MCEGALPAAAHPPERGAGGGGGDGGRDSAVQLQPWVPAGGDSPAHLPRQQGPLSTFQHVKPVPIV